MDYSSFNFKGDRSMSDRAYRQREILSYLKQLSDVEKAPLRDRQEAAREFHDAMAHDPELVAQRVGWLLNGSYGMGSCIKAVEVAKNKRMNRNAALVNVIGALEWHCPARMVADRYKKLTKAQQDALNHAVTAEIKSAEDDAKEQGGWPCE